MSADDTPDVLLRAAKEQAHEFINKPFKTAETQKLVRDVLARTCPASIEIVSAKPEWVEISMACASARTLTASMT